MLDEFNILKSIVQKLNDNNIPYMLTGSVAMSYYSTPRMTRDIDIVIEINDIENFYRLFKDDYYIDMDTVRDSVLNRRIFNIIHSAEIIKIDFIVRKDSVYRKKEFERRKKMEFNDGYIYLVSIEDLIISKLIWYKESESEMQLKDIKNLLKENPDLKYLKEWCFKLDLAELLEEALVD